MACAGGIQMLSSTTTENSGRKRKYFHPVSLDDMFNANKRAVLSPRYTKEPSVTGQLCFCAPTTRAENPRPSLTVPSGRLAAPHQPQDLPSNPSRLANMCSSTKGLEPIIRHHRSSRKRLPTSGLVEKLAFSSVLELGDALPALTTDSMNGGRISLVLRRAPSPRHDDD